jgi:hypothetical protein
MEVSQICRELANNFSYLAEELEKQKEVYDSKLCYIETEISNDKQVLRNIASAILNGLN